MDGLGFHCACGRTNALHRRFCGDCGKRVSIACQRCLFGNSAADKFCGGCGSSTAKAKVKAPGPAAAKGAVNVTMSAPTKRAVKKPPSPPKGASGPALAKRLSALNAENVKARVVTPPPPPGQKRSESEDPEIGQDQIDALFG